VSIDPRDPSTARARPAGRRRRAVARVLALACAASSCAGPATSVPSAAAAAPATAAREPAVAAPERAAAEQTPSPAPVPGDRKDWLRLTSGEWLRGEIEALSKDRLEFDSETLKALTLDWDDVAEVRTTRPFTIVRADPDRVRGGLSEYTGVVQLVNGVVRVSDASGEVSFPRRELFRMVPGRPSEANYWSGRLSAGLSTRSGNSDQLSLSTSTAVRRRTARSRLDLTYDSVLNEVEGSRTTDNQRFTGKQDRFLSPRFYVTPIALELYRDPFQNIELRATPYAGLGYAVVSGKKLEWELLGGLGYRWTRFDSVAPGEDDTRDEATAILGTTVDLDLTSRIDLLLDYKAQIGLQDTTSTNQNLSLRLSVDLIADFKLDVRFVWNRVGDPEPDSSGMVPENDDEYLDVGLGWEF
jgi:putative salt-induced outer membrane protein YdiY